MTLKVILWFALSMALAVLKGVVFAVYGWDAPPFAANTFWNWLVPAALGGLLVVVLAD